MSFRLSASQITTFDAAGSGGCERKWWFEKIAKIPTPQTRGQILGEEIHAQIEHYLRTGEDALGMVARAGKHFLPVPGPDLLVEHAFDGRELDAAGIPFSGRIDLGHTRGEFVDDDGRVCREESPHTTAEIVDWKTSKNVERYAKSPEEIARTPQMIAYAEWARRRWPNVDRVRVGHGYLQTEGPRRARKNHRVILFDTLAQEWHRISRLAERMRDAARATSAEELDPNFDACSAYGGCPFRSRCPKTAEQDLITMLGGKPQMASLMDQLMKVTGGTSANGTAAHVAPPPADPLRVAPPPADPISDIEARKAKLLRELEEMEHAGRATPRTAPAPVAPAPAPVTPLHPADARIANPAEVKIEGSGNLTLTGETARAYARAVGIGEFPPSMAPMVQTDRTRFAAAGFTFAEPGKPAQVLAPDAPRNGESGPPADPLPVGAQVSPAIAAAAERVAPTPAPVAEVAPEAPAKRGRPKKAPTPAEVAQANAFVDAVAPPAPAMPPAPAPAPALNSGSILQMEDVGLHLLVDAYGPHAKPLDGYVDDLCKAIAAQYGTGDLRVAPSKDSPLAFGQWKGILAALARAKPPEAGVWYLLDVRGSEVRQVVAEALRPLCATYVRGV